MALKKNLLLKVAISILSAGIILFLAVFVGIQIGHAFKSGGDTSSVKDGAPTGQPLTGDPIPALKLSTVDGQPTDLREVVSGRTALIAFTMPGCNSCSDLLSVWQRDGLLDGKNGMRVIVVVTTPPDDFDAGELAQYDSVYPMYFCDNPDLYIGLGVRSLPAILTVTEDGTVSFFSDDPTPISDRAYLAKIGKQ